MAHLQLQLSMSVSPTSTLRFAVAIFSMWVLLTAVPIQQTSAVWGNIDPKVPGETFPSCVEVVAVSPEPYSLLKPSSMNSHYVTYEFIIKFSRPVFISWKDSTGGTHPDLRGNFMVFLSPSAYNYGYKRYTPQYLRHWKSNRKMIIAKFTLRRGHLDAIARWFICHVK